MSKLVPSFKLLSQEEADKQWKEFEKVKPELYEITWEEWNKDFEGYVRWLMCGFVFYTIGHTESYERYFEEDSSPKKKGKDGDYPGGSVWRTREEAEKHCKEGYSVYGVIGNWEKDTKPSTEGNWNDLLVDRPLIKLKQC